MCIDVWCLFDVGNLTIDGRLWSGIASISNCHHSFVQKIHHVWMQASVWHMLCHYLLRTQRLMARLLTVGRKRGFATKHCAFVETANGTTNITDWWHDTRCLEVRSGWWQHSWQFVAYASDSVLQPSHLSFIYFQIFFSTSTRSMSQSSMRGSVLSFGLSYIYVMIALVTADVLASVCCRHLQCTTHAHADSFPTCSLQFHVCSRWSWRRPPTYYTYSASFIEHHWYCTQSLHLLQLTVNLHGTVRLRRVCWKCFGCLVLCTVAGGHEQCQLHGWCHNGARQCRRNFLTLRP
jgi:hypothetical protein